MNFLKTKIQDTNKLIELQRNSTVTGYKLEI